MKKQIKRKEGLLMRILKRIFNVKLLKNKVYSALLMLVGYLSMLLLEGDGTVFILTLMIGIPVFFAKENVIN